MKHEDFIKDKIYNHEQYMELFILEMMESKGEHTDKADPKRWKRFQTKMGSNNIQN